MLNIKQSSLLPDRAIIAVAGEGARAFLQGLITNDIQKVTGDSAMFAALLTPQGKFLADFFIIEHEEKLLLDVAGSQAGDIIKRLSMYKLRSKVEISEMSEMRVGAEWSGESKKDARGRGGVLYDGLAGEVSRSETGGVPSIKYHDPRLPGLGTRIIGTGTVLENVDEYESHRLSLGVPDGYTDLTPSKSFPLQWGYDRLNAIDFNKGCYVGQEVTARTKHLGVIRKMVHKVRAEGDILPAKDTPVMAGEKEIGQMAGSVGSIGLALLNIEEVASGIPLYSGGMEIKASLPEWVR